MIKNDVKYVDFFIFRCKARVGNCTLVSVWHPFENYYWICPTSPHHKYISNIFHPQMIEDQNYLELKSRVLCKNWTNCFRAKRFRLFFSPRYLQPDPPRRWATLSDLWGFKLWLLLHLCQTNFVLIFAVCISITTPWIQKYEIVRQGISQFCLDICSLHTINQILNPKRDVTTAGSHYFVSRAS